MSKNHKIKTTATLLQFNATAMIDQLKAFLFITEVIWQLDIQDAALFLGDGILLDNGKGYMEIDLADDGVQKSLHAFKDIYRAYSLLKNPGLYDGEWLRADCPYLNNSAPIDYILCEGPASFKKIARYLTLEHIKQALTTHNYTIH